jgi:subtilisin family serine protease
MLRRSLFLAAPALILASSRGFAQEVVHNTAEWAKPRVMDECLVKLKPGHDLPGDWQPVLKRHGAKIVRYFPLDKLVYVRTPGKDCEILALDLEASNAAEVVYPNYIGKIEATPGDPYYNGGSGTQPNFANVNCPAAWDILKLNGRRDIPPVIDLNTGCQAHTDLAANILTGWNAHNGNTSTPETDTIAPGHGTACASLVCAVTDNATGIASLGWGGTLMPVCVSSDIGVLTLADFITGLQWVLDNVTTTYGPGGGRGVINLSIAVGISGTASGILQALWNAGFFICGSTGDTGTAQCTITGCISPFIMPVASVTNSFARDSYANYGPSSPSSSGGPGTLVAAIVGNNVRVACPTNAYSTAYAGTSFAAPQVAALAQYLWAGNPSLKNYDIWDIIANPANGIATTGFGAYPVSCIDVNKMLNVALNYGGTKRSGRSLLGRR